MACTSLSGIPYACNIFIILPGRRVKSLFEVDESYYCWFVIVFHSNNSSNGKYLRYSSSFCSESVLIFPKF